MMHDEVHANFLSLIASEEDQLSLVIKSHHAIDKTLDRALLECLPASHAIELSRITFLLKTDFLIALGGLALRVRPLFEKTNSMRNRFAHNPYSIVLKKDAAQVKSLLCNLNPPLVEEGFKKEEEAAEILKTLFAVCYFQVEVSYENTCREKVKRGVINQLLSNAAGGVRSRTSSNIQERFIERYLVEMTAKYPDINPKI